MKDYMYIEDLKMYQAAMLFLKSTFIDYTCV